MSDWTPPIITEMWKPRAATQADVNRLLEIEAKYERLMRDIMHNLQAEEAKS